MKIVKLLSAVMLFYGLVPALAMAIGIPRAAVVNPAQIAKSAVEINKLARAITVKIGEGSRQGSGILLQQQGDVYTVLTAAHVVKNYSVYKVITPDDQSHSVLRSSIRQYAGDIDLAVLTFRSNRRYTLAQLGNSNTLTGGVDIYVAGFLAPTQTITQSVFAFREGKVTANSKKAFEKGYALIYSNQTLPGMSGGPVLDSGGKVVGVHGRGDRDGNSGVKTGYNLAIPIARFADIAQSLGVTVNKEVARTTVGSGLTADDYLVAGEQKLRNGDSRGALEDYNKAILLDPRSSSAYSVRRDLKLEKLNDRRGALADFDRIVALSDSPGAYLERGMFKAEKLNDYRGALADYNRYVALSKTADAHYSRGLLKYEKLKDRSGGIADVRQSAKLARTQYRATELDNNLKKLQEWGVSE